MEIVAALEKLISFIDLGRDFKSFAEGGEMHAVFAEVAEVEGKAASRAIEDASRSRFPRVQLSAAVALLRSSYEKHKHNASRKTFGDRLLNAFGYELGSRTEALARAATTALTLAETYQLLHDQRQAREWLRRARLDHDLYVQRATPSEPGPLYTYMGEDAPLKQSRDMYLYNRQLEELQREKAAFQKAYRKVSSSR